ncbi:MAG: sulfurtransferase [Gammaproteobacteria bacterium]|nr:sulfurtransferase [Gammaproteobacteria bacterium]
MKHIIKLFTLTAAMSAGSLVVAAEPLVDVNWIKEHSCDSNVRVLDIRNGIDGGSKAAYEKGHIPCAVYTDYLKGGWRSEVDKVPGQLSKTEDLSKLIGNLGIDNDTHVVVYHHGKNAADMGSATRMYWTFQVLGHDEVSILNGGYLAYAADKKNKIEQGDNKPESKTFTANLRTEMLITKDDVKKAIDDDTTTLVDMRPNHQYVGINRHGKAKRNGTIPTAKNLPESWVTTNGGGAFRPSAELEQLYELAKVDPTAEQISFCNTGHWASLDWFVGSELMGNEKVKLYDGSMVEWSADESLPMEQQISIGQ